MRPAEATAAQLTVSWSWSPLFRHIDREMCRGHRVGKLPGPKLALRALWDPPAIRIEPKRISWTVAAPSLPSVTRFANSGGCIEGQQPGSTHETLVMRSARPGAGYDGKLRCSLPNTLSTADETGVVGGFFQAVR